MQVTCRARCFARIVVCSRRCFVRFRNNFNRSSPRNPLKGLPKSYYFCSTHLSMTSQLPVVYVQSEKEACPSMVCGWHFFKTCFSKLWIRIRDVRLYLSNLVRLSLIIQMYPSHYIILGKRFISCLNQSTILLIKSCLKEISRPFDAVWRYTLESSFLFLGPHQKKFWWGSL